MKTVLRLGLLLILVSVSAPGPSSAAPSPNPWRVVAAAPTRSIYGDMLLGVSAAGKDCAWAVGSNGDGVVIEHWNGSVWKTQVSDSSEETLFAVSAINCRDVWAVGQSITNRALIYRYNGSRWHVMTNVPSGSGKLFAVSGSEPGDIWVANEATDLWRWNGSSWKLMFAPGRVAIGDGDALDVVSPTNVWATGSRLNSTFEFFPQALHWNGRKVTVENLPNPNAAGQANLPSGITTDFAGLPFVAGFSSPRSGTTTFGARLERGAGWVYTAPSGAGLSGPMTDAIAAEQSNNVWSVGEYSTIPDGVEHVYLGHWNGSSWQQFLGPNPGAVQDNLRAVAAIPGTNDFWAAGFYLKRGTDHRDFGLILHCCS